MNELNQLPYDAQVLAFKWYHNIGDPLSHMAHFGSFLSEEQRQKAIDMMSPFKNLKSGHVNVYEVRQLSKYIEQAPIKSNKPTISKI